MGQEPEPMTRPDYRLVKAANIPDTPFRSGRTAPHFRGLDDHGARGHTPTWPPIKGCSRRQIPNNRAFVIAANARVARAIADFGFEVATRTPGHRGSGHVPLTFR